MIRVDNKYFVSSIETQIQEQRKIQDALEWELGRKVNMLLVRHHQSQLLKAYKDEWEKSWRSWGIFKDETREEHMKKLQDRIDDLGVENVVSYLQYLEEEANYAKKQNGVNYNALIKNLYANVMNSFNKEAYTIFRSLVHIEVEIKRLISKQNGHEEYDHHLANLGLRQ